MATSFVNGQALRVYNLTSAPADAAAITIGELPTTDVIACAKSASLSQSNSVIDVTCQGNAASGAGMREIIKGQPSWTVSVETLFTTNEDVDSLDLQAAYDAGTAIDVVLAGTSAGEVYYYGKAIISSLEKNVTPGELVSFNATFEGTGQLYSGTIAA